MIIEKIKRFEDFEEDLTPSNITARAWGYWGYRAGRESVNGRPIWKSQTEKALHAAEVEGVPLLGKAQQVYAEALLQARDHVTEAKRLRRSSDTAAGKLLASLQAEYEAVQERHAVIQAKMLEAGKLAFSLRAYDMRMLWYGDELQRNAQRRAAQLRQMASDIQKEIEEILYLLQMARLLEESTRQRYSVEAVQELDSLRDEYARVGRKSLRRAKALSQSSEKDQAGRTKSEIEYAAREKERADRERRYRIV